ncbi:NAD(P)/FAD-dependent oxidoreductase [Thiomicrorhabdus sediminis]|uniref:NAD(P)/FAD-dependent oxidoreductase n=1 Tax=Thiomicrorhabdus sediminis TaxID=2580412 RepID=A0A4P9K541_9GAMM|nr:NAD(P)/FAD-dependent oxidoreductase [Thiomicrorhabdus sediminis]QCU90082.1 NAD(P)/FAD-dependent oxidoreductase [Thiomicrorhabdus sediminis]
MQRILIVGGGAGGLELATRLGNTLGKQKLAHITLLDQNRVHVWKPLLHEVVAGSFDTGMESLSYRAHSADNHYDFRLGRLASIDQDRQKVVLEPQFDHHGKQILESRQISYDYLVIAVGSQCNDFGISGVKEHCFRLDSAPEAEDLHLTFLNRFLQFSEAQAGQLGSSNQPVHIAIVGGGATGVELAAELYNAVDRFEQVGIRKIHHQSLRVTLVEATDRILPVLPAEIALKAQKTLFKQGVDVLTNVQVKAIEENCLVTQQAEGEQRINADILVWAAGVKAPEFLNKLGLPTNRINQLVCQQSLLVQGCSNIFALGDCASIMGANERPVPATAQAASQQAKLCGDNLIACIDENRRALKPFVYHDHGTLVSLSRFQTLGNLLDDLFHKNWFIEGKIAHWAYISLYRQHQHALHGGFKTLIMMLASSIQKRIKPKLKLY